MRRTRSQRAAALVLIGSSVMLGGCTAALVVGAAAAGIAGTYVYTEGRLESVEDAPLASVHDASLKAVSDLEFTLTSEAKDALSSRIVARRADNSDVRISLDRKTDETTAVTIRVGILGDEEVSSRILNRIRANLGS